MISELQTYKLQLDMNSQKMAEATKGAKPKITGSNPAYISEKYEPIARKIQAIVPPDVNTQAIKMREQRPPNIPGDNANADIIQSLGLSIMA